MNFRSGLLALALTLAPCAAAGAQTDLAQTERSTSGATERTIPQVRQQPNQAPTGLVDPAALTTQIRAQGQGLPHDAARFARLMALVREPAQSLALAAQYANLGGGAGMGMGTDIGTQPQRPQRPPGMGPMTTPVEPSLTALPTIRAVSVSRVIGNDPVALQGFIQALGQNDRQVLMLQDRMSASLLLGDTISPSSVVAIDRIATTGELEVYTIP